MNIPIYRAKKIDSDELVEGSLVEYKYITKEYTCKYNRTTEDVLEIRCVEIDPSTLAVHFDKMISKDDKKIFASLSKDGKGGDMVSLDKSKNKFVTIFHNGKIGIKNINKEQYSYGLEYINERKHIGIKNV